jgi:hypothetical protein
MHGRLGHKCEGTIKMQKWCVKMGTGLNWIRTWSNNGSFLNIIMNLLLPYKQGISSQLNVSFSRMTVHIYMAVNSW